MTGIAVPFTGDSSDIAVRIATMSEKDKAVVIVDLGIAVMMAIGYLEAFGREGHDVSDKIETVKSIAAGTHETLHGSTDSLT